MATEKRLIDANALIELVQFRLPIDNQNAEVIAGCVDITRRLINNAPTVDAVEVVLCKDCKHRGEDGCCPMCFEEEIEWDDDGYTEADYILHDRTADDGFCDRGERIEGE